MQSKELLNLADTITGEINRMCVTHELAELDTMALHARKNIEKLKEMRYEEDFKHRGKSAESEETRNED